MHRPFYSMTALMPRADLAAARHGRALARLVAVVAVLGLAGLAPAQDAPAEAPRFVRGVAAAPVAPESRSGSPGDLATPGTAAEAPAVPRSRRQARVEIDEGTRTLFVTTDPVTNQQIRQVIDALERPVPQALIKVLFLEVTHTNDLDLGVDFAHSRTTADGDRSVVSSLFGVAAENRGGIVTILQNDLEATLRALSEVGTMNVLSRPSILASNNQEATITIGQEVPFIRNSRITDDGQTINTIEYEDIGIILTVTPHIGADGLIALDVAPEISTITGDTVAISDTVNAPVFAKRSAETHVLVPSGRTAVIGGLMEDQETTKVRKVPLLGDIPWLGGLFRRTVTSTSKTELLIFLTPTLVDSTQGVAAMVGEAAGEAELVPQAIPAGALRRYLGSPDEAMPAEP